MIKQSEQYDDNYVFPSRGLGVYLKHLVNNFCPRFPVLAQRSGTNGTNKPPILSAPFYSGGYILYSRGYILYSGGYILYCGVILT
jgi:hypothetical protein